MLLGRLTKPGRIQYLMRNQLIFGQRSPLQTLAGNKIESWRLIYRLRQLLTFLGDSRCGVSQPFHHLRFRTILMQVHLVRCGRRLLSLASLYDAQFIIIRVSHVADGDIGRFWSQKTSLVDVALAQLFLHLFARRNIQQVLTINCWCAHRVLHGEFFGLISTCLCYVELWLHDCVEAFSVCCNIYKFNFACLGGLFLTVF